MACCRFFPVRRYTFLIDDQSEKRRSRRRATRPCRRACSTFSAFCISGNVGKGRVEDHVAKVWRVSAATPSERRAIAVRAETRKNATQKKLQKN
jgi:hypothetical protein